MGHIDVPALPGLGVQGVKDLPVTTVHRLVPAVMEWGDDIKAVAEDESVMLVNHQATGDVCTLMMCLLDKGQVSRMGGMRTGSVGMGKEGRAECGTGQGQGASRGMQ